MVVKSVRGRRRYIALQVPADLRRDDLVDALSGRSEQIPGLKVVTCGGGRAVVRCSPAEVGDAIAAVKDACPGSESLLTSGTLKTLREKYPELKVPRRRKRAQPQYFFIGRRDRVA
jgi:RNase P/RNase MRP subunit POP5